MTTEHFFPYNSAPGGISLIGTPDKELPTSSDDSFKVFATELEQVTFKFSIDMQPDVKAKVFPQEERLGSSPMRLMLVTRSSESRVREAVDLGAIAKASVERVFKKSDWFGSVEVQAVLVRTGANRSLPANYATELGARLAWSEPVRILFDEPSPPPGGHIVVEWEKFSESVDPWRKRYTNHLFALDIAGDNGSPRVVLNSDLPGAFEVLRSSSPHGLTANLRDFSYSLIAHQVWTSLLGTAVGHLAAQGGAALDAGEDPLDNLADWEKDVLVDWSRYLFPDSPEAPIDAVVQVAREPEVLTDILGRIPNAIQERLKTVGAFTASAKRAEVI